MKITSIIGALNALLALSGDLKGCCYGGGDYSLSATESEEFPAMPAPSAA